MSDRFGYSRIYIKGTQRKLPVEDDRDDLSDGGASISSDTADGGLDPEVEFQAIRDKATDRQDLPEDVWGALLFIILKDLPDITNGVVSLRSTLRLALGLLCAITNVSLQFAFLYWIGTWVVQPSVVSVQVDYADFHENMFGLDGQFDEDAFAVSAMRERLCGFVMTEYKFIFAVLFLWMGSCFVEWRKTNRLARMIFSLPSLPSGMKATEMVIEEGETGSEEKLLICMTPCFRALIGFLVVLPKSLIVIFLGVFGLTWLTATESFSDLILNSLALAFVVDIDELIFDAFLPELLKSNLATFKIACQEENDPDRADKKVLAGYTRSWQAVVVCFGVVAVWLHYQWVIPGYKWDVRPSCEKTMPTHDHRMCWPWESYCFPIGR